MITDAQVQLLTDKIADAIRRVDRLERRQPRAPAPFDITKTLWSRYKAAPGAGSMPTGAVYVVQQWSLLEGSGTGVTIGAESGGLPNALFTLAVGLWDVKLSWQLTGGGFDRSLDRCDYWLTEDAGAYHFGDVMTPGYYTANTTAAGDIVSDGTTTVKMNFYTTFAWSLNDLTISFEKKG